MFAISAQQWFHVPSAIYTAQYITQSDCFQFHAAIIKSPLYAPCQCTQQASVSTNAVSHSQSIYTHNRQPREWKTVSHGSTGRLWIKFCSQLGRLTTGRWLTLNDCWPHTQRQSERHSMSSSKRRTTKLVWLVPHFELFGRGDQREKENQGFRGRQHNWQMTRDDRK